MYLYHHYILISFGSNDFFYFNIFNFVLAWLFCKSIWYNSSIYICSKLSNNSISIQQSNHASNDSIQWNNLSILHSSCTCTCNTITTTSISFTISTTHATISTSTTSSLSRGMTHILPENERGQKWTALELDRPVWAPRHNSLWRMTVHFRIDPLKLAQHLKWQ